MREFFISKGWGVLCFCIQLYALPDIIHVRKSSLNEKRTLTKKEEQALLIFERKIFRGIYGPKYENGEWKCGTN